jgi:hypothetical protein
MASMFKGPPSTRKADHAAADQAKEAARQNKLTIQKDRIESDKERGRKAALATKARSVTRTNTLGITD